VRILEGRESAPALVEVGHGALAWGIPVALVALLGAVWLAKFPPLGHVFWPQTNQGIYLYVGQQLLDGAAPYRDVFDNKGPLLYLLNAFGLAVAHGSFWGVYAMEYSAFAVATVLGFFTLRRRLDTPAAAVGMLFFVMLVDRVVFGNLEEEYLLPVQWAALYVLMAKHPAEPRVRAYFFIGVLGALAVFLKPTEVGLWGALVVVELVFALTSRAAKSCVKRLAALAAGGLLGSAVFLTYLASVGALRDFVDQYLLFNLGYTGASSWSSRLSSVSFGAGLLGYLTTGAVLILWFLTCRLALLRWRNGDPDRFAYLAVVWWPLEVLLSSVSGRHHEEFYITWTAPMVLVVALALHARQGGWPRLTGSGRTVARAVTVSLVLLALLGTLAPLVEHARNLGGLVVHPKYWSAPPRNHYAVADYIVAHTRSDDLVLVWGGYSANVNFLAQRRSPSRFPAQMLLYPTTGGYHDELVRSFLDDLQAHPPVMIVDTSPTYGLGHGSGDTPPVDSPAGSWPGGPPAFRSAWSQVFSYLQSTYVKATVLPFYPHWIVYIRRAPRAEARGPRPAGQRGVEGEGQKMRFPERTICPETTTNGSEAPQSMLLSVA